MEGDRRIVLVKPGKTERGSALPAAGTEHVAWAVRVDRGGREGVVADTVVGEWEAVFRVRIDGLAGIGPAWELREGDVVWDIERVSEVPSPPRRWLNLYCARRGG